MSRVVVLMLALFAVVMLAALGSTRRLRESALIAATAVGSATLIITEGLSFFHALMPTWLGLCWALATAAVFAVTRRRVVSGVGLIRTLRVGPLDSGDRPVLLAGAILATGTLAAALLYPISNWDSLTYHMPRIFMWLQNRTVDFYPTFEARQLFSAPLAEYLALNLRALSGGTDRLAGLVQWFAYLFAALSVSLLAQWLGASRRGQQVAALTAATVPMAILQASSTQNDLLCALWCLVAIYVMTRLVSGAAQKEPGWRAWSVWLGVAGALAVATKPTAYLVLLPFAAWLLISCVRRVGWSRTAGMAALALALFLCANSVTYVRNYRTLDGDILGRSIRVNANVMVGDYGAETLLVSTARNLPMLLGTPSAAANEVLAGAARAMAPRAAWAADDARAQSLGYGAYTLQGSPRSHNIAPAPLTLLAIALAAIVLGSARRRSPMPGEETATVTVYGACAVAALLLPAALIAWQPWVNRLLLPSVLTLTPLVGVAWTRAETHRLRLPLAATLTGCVALGFAVMLFSVTNPLAPTHARSAGFWNTRYDDRAYLLARDFAEPVSAIARTARVNDIGTIGIHIHDGPDFPIYHVMAALPDREFVYIENVVLPDRFSSHGRKTDAIIEVIPLTGPLTASKRAELKRGRDLLTPISECGDCAVLFYRGD